MTNINHTVKENSIPNVQFTIWCRSLDNRDMGSKLGKRRQELFEVRRANLRRLIARDFEDNYTAFARAYAAVTHRSVSTAYITQLAEEGGKKSFAEQAVFNVEAAGHLQAGQLNIPNSPLLREHGARRAAEDQGREILERLAPAQWEKLLPLLLKLESESKARSNKDDERDWPPRQ